MSAPETIFQADGLPLLARRLGELGTKRVLVIAQPSRRHVDQVTFALERFSPQVFDGARTHVPAEVVDAAAKKLVETGADTIVTIGGGSAVGLGKALRLTHDVRFAAVPATYAGSEMTTMFGITRGRDKQTGKNPKVRPDLVLYDVGLTRDMPITLTVQSLVNALAHVVSIVSTGLDEREDALAAAAIVVRAIEDLLIAPRDVNAREHALRGASACAAAFDRGTPGAQHALAHLLGGALGVEHAPLHAVLLPHFIAYLRTTNPRIVDELERAIDRDDLDAYVYDLLVRAAAPVSLDALGAPEEAVATALATRAELPAAIAHDAQHGLRPPGRGGRIDLGSTPYALLAGPPPERAKRVVLALHGRGAEAGSLVRRVREIIGHDRDTAVVGLRADAGAERWYAVRYGEAGAGADAEVAAAVARVEAALAKLPGSVVLAGFSQGACLALEVAARRRDKVAGVLAPCGARIGQPDEWAPRSNALAGMPVLVGCSEADKYISRTDLDATIAWMRDAGAHVTDISGPGDRHEITLRQRIAARAIVLGEQPRGGSGFANTLESEALAGALPAQQNSPRVPPFGLYAEQLNGSGFTAPRADNQRTWLYRVRPSAQRRAFSVLPHAHLAASFDGTPEANLCGFAPLPVPDEPRDFVDGLVTVCGAGSAASRRGYAFHVYAANRSMESRAFYSADGDLLVIPEHGALTLATELGPLEVAPGHIAIIPRGIAFSVLLHDAYARGYIAEPFGRHFRLPDRGPIGANGLADARHFRAPAAWYEDRLAPDTRIVAKLGGRLHEASQDHSPFDVVAWHGNYAPWVYDLDAFSPVGNARFDHGDPSVHTVVSAPLDEQGAHTLDLVVFPPRWDPTTNTFRPPFFHRNPTAEINGIVREQAHPTSPFQPGCVFITPSLTAHGVSGRAVERSRTMSASEADKPVQLGVTGLWFQLESALTPVLTPWAAARQLPDWGATWGSHRSYFAP
ncbi:MAG TPA: iron-containing alcohol dehydrogenase [Kofleriaceae bacterium]